MNSKIFRLVLLATVVLSCSCATHRDSKDGDAIALSLARREAVDLCEPVTQRFLDSAKQLGVKTIIRYYEYPEETIPGKTPTVKELELIKTNGFDFLAVFQHNNHRLSSFTAQRGTDDAERCLVLAKLWRQPRGSAVYYGVDAEFEKSSDQAAIKAYATAFARVVRNAGFKPGAYGAGHTLRNLMDAKLIDYAWLSQSSGFKGSREFYVSGRWSLSQEMPTNFAGINVDFNSVNPNRRNFGQWKIK